MWLLPSVDQEVFLQVSQLGEAFVTGLTFEGSLSTVNTKMNLHDNEEGKKEICLATLRCCKCQRNQQNISNQ